MRQRFLIEGHYDREVDESRIRDYFDTVTKALGLRMYAGGRPSFVSMP